MSLTTPSFAQDLHHPEQSLGQVDSVPNQRKGVRVRANGWAQVQIPGSKPIIGRVYDISASGISIFLNCQLVHLAQYPLELQVYRKGMMYKLDAMATCLYSMLVGVDGFKHGFRFTALQTDATTQAIAALTAG